MMVYSYLEERYCAKCMRNVGIECTQMSDGHNVRRCLFRNCPLRDDDVDCLYKERDEP